MQARRKQRIIIGTLVAIIVGMVVGYAALSQVLDISGTSSIEGSFDIQITNIAENTMTGATTESTSGIGSTAANFTVDLEKPGSSAVYDVTVENKGTINAVLKSIEGINEANAASPTDIKFEVSGINTNDGLNAGISKTFQVKVTWDSTSTSIPETSKTLSLKLNYEQKTSSLFTDDSCFTITNSGEITGYTCSDTDVIIPETVNGIIVTSIGDGAFTGKQLTSVVIPDSVTSLGYGAFCNNQLISANIPKGVTTIKDGLFANNQLTSIVIPNNTTTIGAGAFQYNQLTSIVIPGSVTMIGNGAFVGNQLTSVNISEGVETINVGSFSDNQLTSVIIPSSVTTIGNGAFGGNSSLTKIVNKTGRPFDWQDIIKAEAGSNTFITGKVDNVEITAE